MKKYFIGIFLILFFILTSLKSQGQVITQVYIDPCDFKTYVVAFPITNVGVTVVVRGKSKVFSYVQFQSGEVDNWVRGIFSTPCPTNDVVQQTIQQTVAQAAAQAASAAASSAASAAASSASSAAASSSSSESKSESNSESKSEEKKEEKKKEEKKKEEKKQVNNANPLLFGSDLTLTESDDRSFNAIISLGLSKSSLMGNESYSVNSMIWSTFKQFALSSGYTKMDFDRGKLNAIHSYSLTTAYLDGNYMGLVGYTFIKPHPKYGTYGYNIGIVNLLIKDTEIVRDVKKKIFNPLISSSLVTFWTKPYQVSKKLTLSPQVFVMSSPLGYNPSTGKNNVSRDLGFLVGSSFDYKISKRFGLSLNYKVASSTTEGAPFLSNILIGSRLML
jgi:hypothetical protein